MWHRPRVGSYLKSVLHRQVRCHVSHNHSYYSILVLYTLGVCIHACVRLCMHVYECAHSKGCRWRSKDRLWKLVSIMWVLLPSWPRPCGVWLAVRKSNENHVNLYGLSQLFASDTGVCIFYPQSRTYNRPAWQHRNRSNLNSFVIFDSDRSPR